MNFLKGEFMKKIGLLCASFLLVIWVGLAGATTLDFDDSNNLGVSLGGSMTWNGQGGGHIYCEQYYDDDSIMDLNGAYVNSFQMNGMPWENYGGGYLGQIDIEAFDMNSNSVWFQTVDLSNYSSWNNWLTVSVEKNDISMIKFYSPGSSPHYNGFWPSIDNMVINESSSSPVPEPATMLLFGLGIIGISGIVRKKK